MKYSIDYIEENKGYEIVQGLEEAIAEAKKQFLCGECTYQDMLYKIGEKANLVGCALNTEQHYADKEDTEDMWQEDPRIEKELADWIRA